MYSKTLVITQDKRLEQFIKLLMKRRKKEVVTSLPLLSDIATIKNDLQKNKNTLNIRGEFGYFIKNFGFPYMTIMDYKADFGLPEEIDPDKRKLLRTFLISFTILANGKGFGQAVANLTLIVEKKEFIYVSRFSKNPFMLLEQIKTRDPRVNRMLDFFIHNPGKAKDFFHISCIFKPQHGKYNQEIERLEKILDETDNLLSRNIREKEEVDLTEMITDEVEPANVVFRPTPQKVIVNGEIRDATDEEIKIYPEREIFLMGALTVKTMNEVKDRIIKTINTAGRLSPIKKNEKISISIPDTSIIDGSFSSSIGSFITNELAAYSNISINIGQKNAERLKKSKGYFLIKDFVIKNL